MTLLRLPAAVAIATLCVTLGWRSAPTRAAERLASAASAADSLAIATRLADAGNLDGALAVLRRTMGAADEAAKRAAMFKAAGLHAQLGQPDDAMQLYRELLADENLIGADPALARDAHFQLGSLCRQQDNWEQAHQHFRDAATTSALLPSSHCGREAAYWLAFADHRAGRVAAGRQRIHNVLAELGQIAKPARSPRDRELRHYALYLAGQLAIAADDWAAAAEPLDELRTESPGDPLLAQAEFWRAEIAYRNGDDSLARDLFAQVALRTAGVDQPWTALAPLRLAQLEAARQRWEETDLALDWLQWRWPEFPLAFEVDYLRGRVHAGRGEFQSARVAYRRVLGNSAAAGTETAAMAQWMIGETYFHQRVYAEARAAYQAVIENHAQPEWQARSALQLGQCWELEGRWQAAADVYATAAARYADTASGQTLLARRRFVARHLAVLR